MYLDAAAERVEAAYDTRIEEIRVGTLLAHDKKALDKWRQRRNRVAAKGKRGLAGEALEAAVAGIASLFPGNVLRGTA